MTAKLQNNKCNGLVKVYTACLVKRILCGNTVTLDECRKKERKRLAIKESILEKCVSKL